jgi:hypothetical protein
MSKPISLQELIEQNLTFESSKNGWHNLKCKLCNDYKCRAGFKVSNNIIGYNCWNCSTSAQYHEYSGAISKKFREILHSFNIDDSMINGVINTGIIKKENTEVGLTDLIKVSTITPEIKLPEGSFPIGIDAYHEKQVEILEYLISRKIDINRYKFYFNINSRLSKYVIIPFYRNGKLIYWQARCIDKNEKKRYDNPSVSKEAVMFNMDKLMTYSPLPLFVCEGVFDAMMTDGIAMIGSKINDAKMELLKKSKRRLIFLIDKDLNGKKLAKKVLENGWEIGFSPDGSKDINESVQKYGLSYTVFNIIKNIPINKDMSNLMVNIKCKSIINPVDGNLKK